MTAHRKSEHVKSVNSQITDAITQSNTMNIGLAPAQSLGTLYQTNAQAVGMSIQNAVSNQQNMYSLSLASTAQNLNSLLALSAVSAARSTTGLLSSNLHLVATEPGYGAGHSHHADRMPPKAPSAPLQTPPKT
ncbi:RebB family R body protein [Sneathiella litorea]|uniref:Killing trait domain-containing protein n=1 Tax=Sneathiella litorea TaxID=2606216 RepID=A0A6L8W9S6_9PROT|nr:RebB family R body protein [Sneathiella litorea]MZR31785.1 hypothetical protein [Sneathiella litorea]